MEVQPHSRVRNVTSKTTSGIVSLQRRAKACHHPWVKCRDVGQLGWASAQLRTCGYITLLPFRERVDVGSCHLQGTPIIGCCCLSNTKLKLTLQFWLYCTGGYSMTGEQAAGHPRCRCGTPSQVPAALFPAKEAKAQQNAPLKLSLANEPFP